MLNVRALKAVWSNLSVPTIQTIRSRRSIRSFLKKSVSERLINKIISCGLSAPSSKNSNPWFIVRVRGKQKERIADWIQAGAKKREGGELGPMDARTGEMSAGAFDTVAESVQTMREASVVLLMFNRGPLSGGKTAVLENPRGGRSLYTYAGEIVAIGAASQNILLAAKALGLGGVFMADSYPGRMRIQKELETDCELIGSISIGYPAYHAPPRKLVHQLSATWEAAIGKMSTENFTARKMERSGP